MELFMSDKTSLHYYVNMPGNTLPGTSFSTITEALTALTDSSCLSEKHWLPCRMFLPQNPESSSRLPFLICLL